MTDSVAASTTTTLHRCRFPPFTPSAIAALAYSSTTASSVAPLLACLRANSRLELWATHPQFAPIATIPGDGDEARSVAWVCPQAESLAEWKRGGAGQHGPLRLFTATMSGRIVEHDLGTLATKQSVHAGGGSVWSLAVHPSHTILAAGCEDGSVRLWNVADGDLTYIRSLDPAPRRVVSLAWSVDGETLFAGSTDATVSQHRVVIEPEESSTMGITKAVHKWPSSSARKLYVGREVGDEANGTKIVVWCMLMLENGTLITGDSSGQILSWDPRTLTITQRLFHHDADVLCLVASPDSRYIYSAGVDRAINKFTGTLLVAPFTNAQERSAYYKWTLTGTIRSAHEHDIRAMALWVPQSEASGIRLREGGWLITGGLDIQMGIRPHLWFANGKDAKIKPEHRRLPLAGSQAVISLAAERGWVIGEMNVQDLQGGDKPAAENEHILRVWRLGEAVQDDIELQANVDDFTMSTGNNNELGQARTCSAILDIICTGRDADDLTAIVASSDGSWLLVGSRKWLCLYELRISKHDSDKIKLRNRTADLPKHLVDAGIVVAAVASEASCFGIAGIDGVVRIIRPTTSAKDDSLDRAILVDQEFLAHRASEKSADAWSSLTMADGAAAIRTLAISADGKWIASGDVRNRIFIHGAHSDGLSARINLASQSFHTAIAFVPLPRDDSECVSEQLMVATLSKNVHLYPFTSFLETEAKAKADTPSWEMPRLSESPFSICLNNSIPASFRFVNDRIMGITYSKTKCRDYPRAILWGSTFLCSVHLATSLKRQTKTVTGNGQDQALLSTATDANVADGPTENGTVAVASFTYPYDAKALRIKAKADPKSRFGTKRKRLAIMSGAMTGKIPGLIRPAAGIDDSGHAKNNALRRSMALTDKSRRQLVPNFTMTKKYHPVSFAGYVRGGELVIVERPVWELLRNAPSVYVGRKYGK